MGHSVFNHQRQITESIKHRVDSMQPRAVSTRCATARSDMMKLAEMTSWCHYITALKASVHFLLHAYLRKVNVESLCAQK